MPGGFHESALLVFGVLLTFSLSLIGGQPTDQPQAKPASDIHTANKKLGRGVDLGDALDAPKEGAWGVTLKAEYFKAVKKAGFDSVPLPVKWSAHAQNKAPYTIDAKFVQRVDWAIDQALANKLNIVVNIHHYDGMDADPDKHLPRLLAIWEQIATRLKDRPEQVYFELYNEPHDKLTEAKWNDALAKLIPIEQDQPDPADHRRSRPVERHSGPRQAETTGRRSQLDLDRPLLRSVPLHAPGPFLGGRRGQVEGDKVDRNAGRAERFASRLTRLRPGPGNAVCRSTWASSGPMKKGDMESRTRWTHSWPGSARHADLAGRTGSSARASGRTIRRRIPGASRSRRRW